MVMTYVHALVRRDVFFFPAHTQAVPFAYEMHSGDENVKEGATRQDAREFPKKRTTPLGSSSLKT